MLSDNVVVLLKETSGHENALKNFERGKKRRKQTPIDTATLPLTVFLKWCKSTTNSIYYTICH